MPKDDDKGKDDKLANQVAELTKLVGTLAGGFDAQKTAIESLTSNVSQLSNMNQEHLNAQKLSQEQKQQAADAAAADDDSSFDSNALEGMNRSDFMDVILNKVNKGFEKLSGQITGQIDSVKEGVSSSNIKGEYDKVVSDNPDFNHYKAEIAAVAQKNPDMSIEDMYTLAKANNPEKVAEVTELISKEKVTKQAEDAANENKDKSKSFGGLTPTSGQRQDTPSDMTQESAGSAAWEETMAEVALEQ